MNRLPYYRRDEVTLHVGDAAQVLAELPDRSVDCVVTSPPYWGLRDYGVPGQYGHERTPEGYVANLRRAFGEARRVLAVDGTVWLNLGDSYGGSWNNYVASGSTAPTAANTRRRRRYGQHRPPQADQRYKSLLGMPWRVALALVEDGWILRNAIVWHKPNGTPESAGDRLTRRYEMLFLLVRSPRYWFDLDAIREPHHDPRPEAAARPGVSQRPCRGAYGRRPARTDRPAPGGAAARSSTGRRRGGKSGRNPGDVWTLLAHAYRDFHSAVGPVEVPLRCVAAGCRPGGVVCDPFSGTATTGVAALQLGRRYIGIDLNPAFHDLAIERLTRPRDRDPEQRPGEEPQ